ncbi:MAG: Ig-like domain-containing protein [Alistipes sp.]|nr:Ig-like domain-containing protein [Alistipes sp.]
MNRLRSRTSGWLRAAVLLLFLQAFLWRCASVMTVEGGPKDTLPPVIVAMTPDNFTSDFSERKIYIAFDEFVQLKDQQKEFFTSPRMKKKPQLSIRGRGIVIQIKDTLRENTTYALNFGSAVCDNNEGNPLHSMRYVFSTGGEIDSIVCSGYTADSYSADSVAKSFICFFPADSVENVAEYDSTMFNYEPAVIARAENNGVFIAQNLKPIPYRIYAFEDKNGNQIYEPSVDQIGFLSEAYNPAELPEFSLWYDSLRHYVTAEPQLYFRMFTDEAFNRQYLKGSERPARHKALLYFNGRHPQIDSIVFDSIPRTRFIVDPQSRGRDTVALWFDMPAEELPDTIRGTITYLRHDSLDRLAPTTEKLRLFWRYVETKEEARERERLEKAREKALDAGEEWSEPEKPSTMTFKFSATGTVTPETDLSVEFDYPILRLDTAAVLLTAQADKEEAKAVSFALERDTANIRRWHIRTPWKEKTQYALTFLKGALTDLTGERNDSLTTQFKGVDPEKFATFTVTTKGKSGQAHYIVQLLDERGRMLQEKTVQGSGTLRFNYVPAGNVKFRIVEDANGNGLWDPGNLVERRQPERAEYYVDAKGADTFAAKENWEMELTMDMNEVFAPITMQSLAAMLDQREEQRLRKLEEERKKPGGSAPGGNNIRTNTSVSIR